uniref:Uncharacterized protein n=1 Tax=Arundo donax TaxID=35708 RepID=A0A0A8XS84_ARUDO
MKKLRKRNFAVVISGSAHYRQSTLALSLVQMVRAGEAGSISGMLFVFNHVVRCIWYSIQEYKYFWI